MLDDKNKLILEYLMHDCRISTTKLAKITNLSQPSVVYRIKKLEKENYIQQYDVLLDYNKFNVPMVIFFIKVPNSKKEDFLKWCEKEKELVHSLFSHINIYNYSITSILTNNEIKMLEKYFQKNNFKFFYKIYEKFYSMPFSIFDLNIDHKNIKESNVILNLDEVDVKILNRLEHKGGRDSILELSNHTGLTYDLVLYRYKKLKQAGYLKLFCAIPNLDKFHIQYDYITFKLENINEENIVRIFRNIKKCLFVNKFNENEYGITISSISIKEYKFILKKIIENFDEHLVELKEYMMDKAIILNRFDLKKILK